MYLYFVFVLCICIFYLYFFVFVFVFCICICILYLYLCLSDHLPFPSLSKWRKPSTKSSTVSVIFLPDTACHQKSCNFCHTLDFIKKSCHFLHWIFCLHWISSKSCQTLPSLWAAGWYHFHYRLEQSFKFCVQFSNWTVQSIRPVLPMYEHVCRHFMQRGHCE